VVRKFKPFDEEVLVNEFRRLDAPHRAKLAYAMERYQASLTTVSPALIQSGYPGGVLEIRHENGAYKGRGLFWPESSTSLVLLIVYRKDSKKTPDDVKATAQARLDEYRSRK
jgi:phage-related protein